MQICKALPFVPLLWMVGVAGCDDPEQLLDGGTDLASGESPDLASAPDLALPPPPPGIKYIDISNVADVTPDGRFALLQDLESPTGDVYVYDSYLDKLELRGAAENPDPALGNTDLGTPVVPQGVFGFSADNSRVVGTHGVPLEPAFLTVNGWTDLPVPAATVCPGATGNLDDQGMLGSGWDISDNGGTIVGMAWQGCGGTHAVRWVEQMAGIGTFTELEFAGKSYNRATKVSADGSIVGGWVDSTTVDRSPALWRADGSVIVLDPTGMVIGEVLALSGDGKIAAGPWNDTANHGFYWTEAAGVKLLPSLATAQPSDQMFPNAIAAGGQLIFGAAGDQNGVGSPMQAWVWTAKDNQIRPLQDIVTQAGFTVPGHLTLANVTAASTDGSVVLGTTLDLDPALPLPKQRAFLLRLPVSAYGL